MFEVEFIKEHKMRCKEGKFNPSHAGRAYWADVRFFFHPLKERELKLTDF